MKELYDTQVAYTTVGWTLTLKLVLSPPQEPPEAMLSAKRESGTTLLRVKRSTPRPGAVTTEYQVCDTLISYFRPGSNSYVRQGVSYTNFNIKMATFLSWEKKRA